MKKALFVLINAQGHLNGSLKVSIPLRQKGYQIYYATNARDNSWYRSYGFILEKIQLYRYKFNQESGLEDNLAKQVFNCFLNKLTSNHLDNRICQILELQKILDLVEPDLVFIDSFLTDYHVAFENFPCRCFQLETMVIQDWSSDVPPLNSLIVPSSSFLNKVHISLIWNLLSLKKILAGIFLKTVTFSQDVDSIWKKSLQYFNQPYQGNSNQYLFHRRLNKIPCVVTSPRYFDFPRKPLKNVFYTNTFIEPSMRVNNQKSYDLMDQISEIRLRKVNSKIIYCSLGTLLSGHVKNANTIIDKIMHSAANLTEYHLILSLGNSIPKNDLKIPKNTYVFDFVNQLEVLNSADLMITHGGMNTISECIFAEVPMLVFPLNSKWDQNGNAARVKYHKIGLKGNIVEDTESEITEKIQDIINNKQFKINISNLKKKIQTDKEEVSFFNYLEKLESSMYTNNILVNKH